MELINKKKNFSLRNTYRFIIVISGIVTAILLFTTFRTFKAYHSLSTTTDKYIELQEIANRLLQASDYLTEEAQCYTVNGDRRHLENYFEEVEVHQNREKAIEEMEKVIPESEALRSLTNAMDESVSLMDREYHAMRLVLSAQEDTDIPKLMQGISLSPNETRLSSSEKMALAQDIVHNNAYYNQKNIIYSDMEDCIESLKKDNLTVQKIYEKRLYTELICVGALIFGQSLFLLFVILFTVRTGVKPLVRSAELIKKNELIPLSGAIEFQCVAAAYNRMYTKNKFNIEEMSFKALHDELTGLYNRAGYDHITPTINPATTAFILIDTDKFKKINDNYGHDVGDKVLCKIADTLTKNFRPNDFIFRIGGDEFVILMINVSTKYKDSIGEKITSINNSLAQEKEDKLPKISISAGIDISYNAISFDQMYKHADKALYKVKENGRGGYRFY